MKKPWNLNFWDTGEWQVIDEHLRDLRKRRVIINPDRTKLFRPLETSSPDQIKVAIFGQDPYPDHDLATGYAFSIPSTIEKYPSSLKILFDEYVSDLHYNLPATGDLTPWCNQGVLLWNVIPTCTEGHSLSHDWPEWEFLNREIVDVLASHNVVFCFLGAAARRYAKEVPPWLPVIETAHPSPRANISSKTPFKGSRIFTKVNDALIGLKKEPIDWRLP